MKDGVGRWYPDGATRLEAPEVNAVAYLYGLSAIAYHGKATKPDWHYSFKSEERRLAYLNKWRANLAAHRDSVAKIKAERATFEHTLKVGDVLHYSWGYDQTNLEFYEVVGTSRKSVSLRRIAAASTGQDGFMSGHYVPLRGKYLEPALRLKPVRPGNYVSMKFGSASKWTGSPSYASWYA